MSKTIGSAGLALIKSFEGCSLTAYKAVSTETYYTIGWGHYGSDVTAGQTITQAQADALLLSDLKKYVGYVNTYVTSFEPHQNQFDALVSFCYNCGAGNLKSLCNGRTAAQVSEHIVNYNKSSGTVLAGLTRRRKAEQTLFNTAVSGSATTTTTSTTTVSTPNDIAYRLKKAGIASASDYWMGRMQKESTVLALCKNIANYTLANSKGAGTIKLTTANDIIYRLFKAGILANKSYWMAQIQADKNLFALCRNAAEWTV